MSLDDYWPPPEAPDPIPTPRPCRHPKWKRQGLLCTSCGHEFDEARTKRGRSSRRLGHDGERRSEKRYGWRKVGEFGGITDLEGTLAIVQQKTSRRPAPPKWRGIFRELDTRAGGRIPLVLLSFVHAGLQTDDYIVIRGQDWLALHGRDEAS